MALANAKGYTFVFGGDVNARNFLYGCKTTDKRGRQVEDIFSKYGLFTLNIGNTPTCTAGQFGSIIDVTAITSGMESMITNWRVTKLQSESDHRIISFELAIPKTETKTKNFMSNKNKNNFRMQLEEASKETHGQGYHKHRLTRIPHKRIH